MLPPGSAGADKSGAVADKWVAIIDDHESMRSSLARAFALERIRTTTFASAAAYLAHRMSTAPCCLVLDVQLPDMSGVELARRLACERPPLPPTIFISGHEDLLASLADNELAYGRLRKPFNFEELLRLVKPLYAAGNDTGTRDR